MANRLDIKRINDITPEEFYELIARNREHIYKTFPVTATGCSSPDKAKTFIQNAADTEQKGNGYYFYLADAAGTLKGYICIKNIEKKINKCELAYFIDKSLQGQGIITKMVGETVAFCFDKIGMNKVFICTSKTNIASQRVALKNGFVQEGILREEFKNGDGQLEDIMYFGLLKSRYNER